MLSLYKIFIPHPMQQHQNRTCCRNDGLHQSGRASGHQILNHVGALFIERNAAPADPLFGSSRPAAGEDAFETHSAGVRRRFRSQSRTQTGVCVIPGEMGDRTGSEPNHQCISSWCLHTKIFIISWANILRPRIFTNTNIVVPSMQQTIQQHKFHFNTDTCWEMGDRTGSEPNHQCISSWCLHTKIFIISWANILRPRIFTNTNIVVPSMQQTIQQHKFHFNTDTCWEMGDRTGSEPNHQCISSWCLHTKIFIISWANILRPRIFTNTNIVVPSMQQTIQQHKFHFNTDTCWEMGDRTGSEPNHQCISSWCLHTKIFIISWANILRPRIFTDAQHCGAKHAANDSAAQIPLQYRHVLGDG